MQSRRLFAAIAIVAVLVIHARASGAEPPPVVTDVEGQPLAAAADRLARALQSLGVPLPTEAAEALKAAVAVRDAARVQKLLDPLALFVVGISPEGRVRVARGPAPAILQQSGYVPLLVKVVNESTVTRPLRISSPQSGPVHHRSPDWMKKEADVSHGPDLRGRFLQVAMFTNPPMTADLSGLRVEYAIALVYSAEAGRREATIRFDLDEGDPELGSRGEVPILFDVKPAVRVKLRVRDFDGTPTVGRFTFRRDGIKHTYPPQPKRVAPDLHFQPQIYRADGETVLLPPGRLTMEYGRGPEYRLASRVVDIPSAAEAEIAVDLERWVNPADHGWFGGDHHIHAAGCSHYTSPTEGVFPADMFRYVKGEGLNVGCCLTWGPCFDFQRQFFGARPDALSEPMTVLKYDVEVSGFGSQALGHVCLLNLTDMDYPGSGGSKLKGWPSWTTPLMQWAKAQGAVTGYAHSANGLGVNPADAARRLMAELDANGDRVVTREEAAAGRLPLPEAADAIDVVRDGRITELELVKSHERVRTRLPNLAIPQMNGIGAQEICVTAAQGLCDFISAMDTERVAEWNCWYQIMNCGFPLKVSGETDFPCVSDGRVGQGRVYVQLGKVDRVDFAAWCDGIRLGRSYVSDGYAHALDFRVGGVAPGSGELRRDAAGDVEVKATLAFAADLPMGTSIGADKPVGKVRTVELVVNGKVAATSDVPADGRPHDVSFTLHPAGSCWVTLRQFPQLHTNPVNVIIGGKPIRASRDSAMWCAGVIEQLWRVRESKIEDEERAEAEKTFRAAIETYRRIASEAPSGS
jgi:hypothetical protein